MPALSAISGNVLLLRLYLSEASTTLTTFGAEATESPRVTFQSFLRHGISLNRFTSPRSCNNLINTYSCPAHTVLNSETSGQFESKMTITVTPLFKLSNDFTSNCIMD